MTTAKLIQIDDGTNMFSPTTLPASLSKSLEETISIGSMNDSFAALSFAESNDSQTFETSFTFEMALDVGEDLEDGPNPIVMPKRPSRPSSQDTTSPRPSCLSMPKRTRSEKARPSRKSANEGSAPLTPKRLPSRSSAVSSSHLNRSLSGLSGCSTPLSRQKSKLCLLSRSQHGSQHSSRTVNSTGALSRNGGMRRRPMDKSMSSLSATEDESFDGNGSAAQLQVGDRVLLANKELSTSSHLIRRMPRSRRSGTRRNGEKFPRNSSRSEEGEKMGGTLMETIAARSRE